MKNWKFAVWLLILGSHASYAQLSIFSPVSHQVMQRNAAGLATIPVTAYSYFPYSNIKATLTPIEGNLHSGKQINIASDQIAQGFLHFTFQAESGWYQLKLVGETEHGFTDSTTIERVGVGEVFLVAGNSNAMGLPDLGAKDASDQVISINATNKVLNTENITVAPDAPMPQPVFDVLVKDHFIFPNGETAWLWGELGDMLSERWNTPVLFFNAAWAAANSENYRDAATGKDAFNLYVGKHWPNRQPYSNIVNTMRYFTSWTGMRAVLWSHGENDAQLGFTEENYFSHIRTLIQNTRTDAGYNMPWFIARNTASNSRPDPYLPILSAQNRLTELPGFNAYKGPYLDTVQMPRPPSAHFENIAGGVQGLTRAANAWSQTLSDSVIRNTKPIQPAYSIHTGVAPSKLFPGAVFLLPFKINGNVGNAASFKAELLDQAGNFVASIGSGQASPLQVTLPAAIGSGSYRLRITGFNPVLPGSVSDSFYVDRSYKQIDYVNRINVRLQDEDIYVSWLLAGAPAINRIVLQKTTNGYQYQDLQSFNIIPNQSQVFVYRDQNLDENAIFYRIRQEFQDGTVAYSTVTTLFQNSIPPDRTVFPNPVSGQQFYLKTQPGQILQCALFDVKGKELPITVSEREVTGLIVLRPAYPLSSGVYILRINDSQATTSHRVLFN